MGFSSPQNFLIFKLQYSVISEKYIVDNYHFLCNYLGKFNRFYGTCIYCQNNEASIQKYHFLCPRYGNGGGNKCYFCPSDLTYVRPDRRPLSNPSTFYQNFMKLGHIVKYNNVFFKFDNGQYRTRLSVVMALVDENSLFLTKSAL